MIQVAIADNMLSNGISIAMRMKPDPVDSATAIMYAQPSDSGFPRWEMVSPQDAGTIPAPWMTLDEDMARALLDALQRHYQGSSDTRALRADYDAERKRVDKLTDLLSGLATALVHRAAS